VIPVALNVAPGCSWTVFRFRRGVILPLSKPLPRLSSGAIMKLK
jgi:hypothetical protein